MRSNDRATARDRPYYTRRSLLLVLLLYSGIVGAIPCGRPVGVVSLGGQPTTLFMMVS
ncbi:MAG TPA: hypothetical protein VKR06_27515 [Ktedonosporobacter sp.]|nr:hypothetical protein [Ktedonosporobacter sp.]